VISFSDQNDSTAPRWERMLLLLFLVLAIVTRVGLAELERVVKWDESDYLMLGRNLWAGRGFTTAGYPEVHYPPLLPFLLGLTYSLTRQAELASNIWYILCSALLVLPYYGLARCVYGRRVGYMAVALLLTFPALAVSVLYWGTMSEPLYLLLVYTGLYAAWQAIDTEKTPSRQDAKIPFITFTPLRLSVRLFSSQGGWVYYAWASLMFALAYLTRPEGILYFVLFLALIVIWRAAEGRLGQKESWRGLLVYVAIFALCVLPYVLYLHRHTGQWAFSGKVGVTFALGEAVVERDPAAYDAATASLDDSGHHIIWFSPQRFRQPGMLSQVLADPAGYLKRILANARSWQSLFFTKTAFPYWLLGLVFLAWCKSPWTRPRARKELFLLAAILPPFAFLALHIELRFFAPIFPVLLLWVARGLDEAGLWLRDTVKVWRDERPFAWRGGEMALRVLPLFGLLLYFVLMQPVTARAAQRGTDFSCKRAGLWLKEHTLPQARIMSRDVAVAVYAERAWVPSPHADLKAYLDYVRYHRVDYLLISQREGTILRPMLAPLLDEANPPAELELVHVDRGERGQSEGKTLVYRVR